MEDTAGVIAPSVVLQTPEPCVTVPSVATLLVGMVVAFMPALPRRETMFGSLHAGMARAAGARSSAVDDLLGLGLLAVPPGADV